MIIKKNINLHNFLKFNKFWVENNLKPMILNSKQILQLLVTITVNLSNLKNFTINK